MRPTEELLAKAERAFETARGLLYFKKENEERQAGIRKNKFGGNPSPRLKAKEKECEKQEQLWKMAAEMFLKENNLSDKTMGEIESFILSQGM